MNSFGCLGFLNTAIKAFANNHKLKEIILPHKIHVIGKGAFEGCEKLIRIYMPDCLEHIEAGAFCMCI